MCYKRANLGQFKRFSRKKKKTKFKNEKRKKKIGKKIFFKYLKILLPTALRKPHMVNEILTAFKQALIMRKKNVNEEKVKEIQTFWWRIKCQRYEYSPFFYFPSFF